MNILLLCIYIYLESVQKKKYTLSNSAFVIKKAQILPFKLFSGVWSLVMPAVIVIHYLST